MKGAAFTIAGVVAAGGLPMQAQAKSIEPIVVVNDLGGLIQKRRNKINKLRLSGQPVIIEGRCASACTMYLFLENTCVMPNASLGFHGPRPFWGGRLPPFFFDHWSEIMSEEFREPLRSWFMEEARYEIEGMLNVKGSTLIDMGYTQCGPRKPLILGR